MNKQERRETRRREKEARQAEQAKNAKAIAERTAHHPLFDALPTSLDSLVGEHFKGRAWLPYDVKPSQWGYHHLIDDRDVNDAEHDEVCRVLHSQLKAIADWCHSRKIDLEALVDDVREDIAELHRNPHVTPESPDEKRCQSWLLDVVSDLATGADDAALNDLKQMGKLVPVSHTMSLIRVRIDEQFRLSERADSGCNANIADDTKKTAEVSTNNDLSEQVPFDEQVQLSEGADSECNVNIAEDTTETAEAGASDDLSEKVPSRFLGPGVNPPHNCVFRPDGDGYFIEGFGEAGHLTAKGAKGLHDLFRLIQASGSLVPMREIDTGNDLGVIDLQSRQPVADFQTMQEVKKKRQELKAEIEACQNEAEQTELQAELEELEAEAIRMVGKGGRLRDMNNPLEKLRPKLLKRQSVVVKTLKFANMPKLAEHFENSVASESGCMVYRKPFDVVWKTKK